jgi:hypothetical protein
LVTVGRTCRQAGKSLADADEALQVANHHLKSKALAADTLSSPALAAVSAP